MLLRSIPTWLSSWSFSSGLRPVSNSTAMIGARERVALLKSPKYCPATAPAGEVELERTKAMPKPGLFWIWGRIEKIKEVENEEMVVLLLLLFMWLFLLMGSRVGKKALPMENWLVSLVSRTTGESTRASRMRSRSEVVLKELKRKSKAVEPKNRR